MQTVTVSPAVGTNRPGTAGLRWLSGRRLNVNDVWIAATALTNGLPVVTQDDDFDALADLRLLDVVRV